MSYTVCFDSVPNVGISLSVQFRLGRLEIVTTTTTTFGGSIFKNWEETKDVLFEFKSVPISNKERAVYRVNELAKYRIVKIGQRSTACVKAKQKPPDTFCLEIQQCLLVLS